MNMRPRRTRFNFDPVTFRDKMAALALSPGSLGQRLAGGSSQLRTALHPGGDKEILAIEPTSHWSMRARPPRALPTLHILCSGVQAKKRKLDASGVSKHNVAEIHNQITMMLGHEIFGPETSRRALVDHAFIVAAGEKITKQARNWIGNELDATGRIADRPLY